MATISSSSSAVSAFAAAARLSAVHTSNAARPNIVAMSIKASNKALNAIHSHTDVLSSSGKDLPYPDNVDSSPVIFDNPEISSATRDHTTTFNLMSVSPLPLVALASLPGASSVAGLFEPLADVLKTVGLPEWLVHWGHPGNMAVVLFAMGGYGSYLGWQIRLSDDLDVKAQAKDLHPKLLGGMFFFFSLGATGGILSLLMSGKPIFESPHAVTGFLGLAALAAQTALTGLFESNPSLRGVHGLFGSGIMLLFLIHAIFGLQLGLSF